MQDISEVTSSLGHLPTNAKWEFDDNVTQVFSDMLERSIPQYGVMRSSVFDIAYQYVKANTQIVDLGCSKGDALEPFIYAFGSNNRYLGIEYSTSMLEVARARYKELISSNLVEIKEHDLRNGLPENVLACVTLSVLTLQFTPIEYRLKIIRDIYKRTISGGAFILVEKVLGDTAELDSLMVNKYYALKSKNGYSQEEIDRKRLSLEGVLVPVTAKWNEEMLRHSGFSQIDCFWRWMNFAGWIAIKD